MTATPRWKDGTVASIPELQIFLQAFGFADEAAYERYEHQRTKKAKNDND